MIEFESIWKNIYYRVYVVFKSVVAPFYGGTNGATTNLKAA